MAMMMTIIGAFVTSYWLMKAILWLDNPKH